MADRMRKPIPEAAIMATIERQRVETRARLASDPEFIALKTRAEREAVETPECHLARNILALHEEISMPGIVATVTRARSEYAAETRTWWRRMLARWDRKPTDLIAPRSR